MVVKLIKSCVDKLLSFVFIKTAQASSNDLRAMVIYGPPEVMVRDSATSSFTEIIRDFPLLVVGIGIFSLIGIVATIITITKFIAAKLFNKKEKKP